MDCAPDIGYIGGVLEDGGRMDCETCADLLVYHFLQGPRLKTACAVEGCGCREFTTTDD